MECQGFTLPGDDDMEAVLKCEAGFDDYHTRCMDRIQDVLSINKKLILTNLKHFIA
jgi:hypothetical protein